MSRQVICFWESHRMVSLSQRLSRSGALTSACLHVHVGRALLFSFPCRSQRCHDISRIGSSQKVIRIVLHAHATHFLSSSRQEALLYVFEDNEAVIMMITKGRSPSMRQVSRTHRVVLDWLFDRINLDLKIQINYIDTKNQLADILTKGKFHTWWMESSFVFV